MRLIGLLFVALLLAALATLAYDRGARRLPELAAAARGGPLVHDRRWDDPDAMPLRPGSAPVALPHLDDGRWTGLSGLDGYARLEFPLPRGAEVLGGELDIRLVSELEKGATARLRVHVGGARRAEIVLERGLAEHRLLLPLRPGDLSGRRVVAALSAEGVAPHAPCRPRWDGGVVVAVKPSSRLNLTLARPLSEAEDRLLAAGPAPRVVWPGAEEGALRSALLRLAFDREGVKLVEPPPAGGRAALRLGPAEARRVAERAARAARRGRATWPMPLSRLGVAPELREAGRRARWRIRYDRRLLPGQGRPRALLLDMRIAGLRAEDWLLTVARDGRLLHAETVAGARGAVAGARGGVRREIALPPEAADARPPFERVLEATLRRRGAAGEDDPCREPPPAAIALAAGSALLGAPDPDFMEGLFAALDGPARLEAGPGLDARGARAGVAMLRALFPPGVLRLVSAERPGDGREHGQGPGDGIGPAGARIILLPAEALAARAAEGSFAAPGLRRWLIRGVEGPEGGRAPRVEALAPGARPRAEAGEVVALVAAP